MYQRILVPVDGSDTSMQALKSAVKMAKESGGRLRLLHAVDEMAYVTGYEAVGGYSGDLINVMRESGAKVLKEALAVATSSGVPADSELFDRFGDRLAEVVADAAVRWSADLIVVGTHGRRGIGRVLLGSGAEQIIRTAPVPVLVIRSPEGASDEPA
jgi:nucleotide-binding universal stress UspA family protein